MCHFHSHDGEIDVQDDTGRRIATISDIDERDAVIRKTFPSGVTDDSDDPRELDFESTQ